MPDGSGRDALRHTLAAIQRSPARGDGYTEFPADPWSPDGTLLLAGNGVYRCDACQALQGLQATAESRHAWSAPLSVGSDHPPATDPYA